MKVTLNEESQAKWNAENAEALRYNYALGPNDLVIDVGAYRGEFAAEIFARYHSRLVLIEPGPWANGFLNGVVFNEAAATYDGMMRFGGQYYYTSSHEPGEVDYPCININNILGCYGCISLLKMNVEGAEYELMPHILKAGHQYRIRDFQIQFHQIEGEPFEKWYRSIAQALSMSHEVTWRYEFCWENWRLKGLPK